MTKRSQVRPATARLALIAILVILLVLLAGLSYFIVSLIEPLGQPDSGSLPEGLEWVRSIYGYGSADDQQLRTPDHVEIAPDGGIWVADTQLNSVLLFSPDGTLRRRIEMSSFFEGAPSVLPKGIAVGPDGELYVCATNASRVLVIDPSGTLLRSWSVDQPLDCDVYEDRVYVTGPSGVSVFSREGESVGNWGGRGKALAQVDLPQGVVVGEDGTVYVSDTLNALVKAFDQDGKLLWSSLPGVTGAGNQAVSGEASTETSGTGLQLPASICIDGTGRLVLVDPFGFNIVVMDASDGTVLGRYGDYGAGDGLFAYPTGIAYDAQRDWFAVADTANGRVQIVRIPDSGSAGVVSAARRALVGPIWICLLPLGLLLLVAIATLAWRRRPSSVVHDESHDSYPDEVESE